MTLIYRNLALVAAILMLLVSGCGSEEKTECVANHCIEGQTACFGSGFASCSAAGTWQISSCGAASTCNPATKTCETRQCSSPGAGTCVATDKVSICSEDGSYLTRSPVQPMRRAQGACLKAECEQASKACAFGTDGPVVMVCDGIWKIDTECGAGQLCSTETGTAQCVSQACVPDARSCDGNVAVTCSGSGATETRTCVPATVCDNRAYVAKICSAGSVGNDARVRAMRGRKKMAGLLRKMSSFHHPIPSQWWNSISGHQPYLRPERSGDVHHG